MVSEAEGRVEPESKDLFESGAGLEEFSLMNGQEVNPEEISPNGGGEKEGNFQIEENYRQKEEGKIFIVQVQPDLLAQTQWPSGFFPRVGI